MKQYRRPSPFIALLFFAVILWPLHVLADETGKEKTEASPPQVEQPAPPLQGQSEEDMRALRQRYGKDPTGVRARLGLCRRGHGRGHGMGHGRCRGQGRGPIHDPNRPCPYGEHKWHKQP